MIDGERKLATIRRVSNIEPIPGADAIVKLTVDGWELVSGKDNFQIGDLCVYFEIDSFLPVRPEFEFLRDRCFKSTKNLGDGFRLKTIKLRGQVSQGLALPLSDFLDRDEDGKWVEKNVQHGSIWFDEENYDLTEYLKVQKYEKPEVNEGARMGGALGHFPDFLHKTDQERIQNCLKSVMNWIYYDKPIVEEITDPIEIEVLNMKEGTVHEMEGVTYFKSGDMWFARRMVPNTEEEIAKRRVFELTMKLDGSSMTVYYNEGKIGVCSRNLELKRDPENVFWKTAIKSKMIGALAQYGANIAIQGELMGPGVQGNREKLPDHELFVFDIYLIDEKRYMSPPERHAFWNAFSYELDVEHAKHISAVVRPDAQTYNDPCLINNTMTVADFLKIAEIGSIVHEIGEGVVFKSWVQGGPTFKAINNTFLLKEKD